MRVALGLGVLVAVLVAAAPFGYWSAGSVRYRNFRVVKDGELYRSGQMSPAGFAQVMREFGIRSVVSLRDRTDDSGTHQDQTEADFCAATGRKFFRFPPGDWSPVNGVVPGDRTVRDFLAVMSDPANRPVLVHCFAGIHRTGAHCAAYRIAVDGWPACDAIAEMKSKGTPRTTFAPNLLDYLTAFEPYRAK